MLKKIVLVFCLIGFLTLIGCQNNTESKLTIEDVINAFKTANIPIGEVQVYTDETDPEHLLNRPGWYIGKAVWQDKRLDATDEIGKQVQKALYEDHGLSPAQGGCIRVFRSQEDLERNKALLDAAYTHGIFFQYIFAHKNVILQIDNKITPNQAEEYKKALQKL